MGIVKNKSLNEEQRIRRVEQYADRFLDYERLSATAVGLPWRQFSAAQKQEFIRAFKDMIIAMSRPFGHDERRTRRGELRELPASTLIWDLSALSPISLQQSLGSRRT